MTHTMAPVHSNPLQVSALVFSSNIGLDRAVVTLVIQLFLFLSIALPNLYVPRVPVSEVPWCTCSTTSSLPAAHFLPSSDRNGAAKTAFVPGGPFFLIISLI